MSLSYLLDPWFSGSDKWFLRYGLFLGPFCPGGGNVKFHFDLCYLLGAHNDRTSWKPHYPASIQALACTECIINSQDTVYSSHPLLPWRRTNILGLILVSVYSIYLTKLLMYIYSTMLLSGTFTVPYVFIDLELFPLLLTEVVTQLFSTISHHSTMLPTTILCLILHLSNSHYIKPLV